MTAEAIASFALSAGGVVVAITVAIVATKWRVRAVEGRVQSLEGECVRRRTELEGREDAMRKALEDMTQRLGSLSVGLSRLEERTVWIQRELRKSNGCHTDDHPPTH